MRNNIVTLKKVIYYMESNEINVISFYPDDKCEFWELNDGTKKNVECKNNIGIINKWNLSDECKECEYVNSNESLLRHYSFIDEFNQCNAFDLSSIKGIIDQITLLLD